MAGRIPEEIVEKVRRSQDIVDVISEYVNLSRKGRNYFGLCPFHGENTPSFSVAPDKQIYYCFGCGAGGNVLQFVMDMDGLTFTEAVARLASKSGVEVDLPTDLSEHVQSHHSEEHQGMLDAHELLRKFYHHLLVNTKQGEEALLYLHDRGFTDGDIESFHIGYAPPGWDTVKQFLTKRGFTEELLHKCGLLVSTQDGTTFDRFRDRIMFPLFDHHGHVVAFSGRVFKEKDKDEPKYLNSPESIIFQKSELFYHFYQARSVIRKTQSVILFEGFTDTILAYRAGIQNGVATMGTSLTDSHIQLLKRHTKEVVLCFDSDSPGLKASERAGKALEQSGLRVRVVTMKAGMDPDEFIRAYGPEVFVKECVEDAEPYVSFLLNYYRKGKNLEKEGERLLYLEQVLQVLASRSQVIERDVYLTQISEEFRLSKQVLNDQLQNILKANVSRGEKKEVRKKSTQPLPEQRLRPAYEIAERRLLAYMMQDIEMFERIQQKMQELAFHRDQHQAILTYLLAYYEEGYESDVSRFLQFVEDDTLQKDIISISMMTMDDVCSDEELDDYIHQVKKASILFEIEEMRKQEREAQREHDHEKELQLALEILSLRKML